MINHIMNIAEYKHETVSGQGSVSWDDGVKCYIPSVKVTGKAEQETYSGVNLWNNKAIVPVEQGNGIAITEVSDSYIIITSQPSYTLNGYVDTRKTLQELCPSLLAGGTYYLWAQTDAQYSTNRRIYMYDTKKGWNFGRSITLTAEDLSSPVWLYGLCTNQGEGTGECRISNVMVTASSVQPSYEPYVGGMSAPNPQYPFYPTFTTPRLNALSVNESSTQPEYTPYFDGGAVQCPELYATLDGEFTDIYDTQSGIFLHNMDKVELTGTESITASTAYGNGVKISGVFNGYVAGGGHIGLCSHAIVDNDKDMHFGSINKAVFWHNVLDDLGMTLDDFKAWLTNQYELGSPVTIWYPLLYPTETTVQMPEKLKMPKGSGQIIQIDNGLVADIEAKVLKHS